MDKRISERKLIRVGDCAAGDIVIVEGGPHRYYIVTAILSTKYAINLETGCYLGAESRVDYKVCAEVHVTGVEPV